MESSFQNIADCIMGLELGDWNRIVLYAHYTDDSFEIKIYVKNKEGMYSDCYKLGIDSDELDELMMDLDDIIVEHREEMGSKGDRWSVMTMIIEESGDCKVDYEYEVSIEEAMENLNKWSKKYLI